MNVLYTCDNNYLWLMGISALSLFENNKNIKELQVFLLGANISPDNKTILKEISEKYNRVLNIIDVPKLDIPDSLISARWPISAFTRLYAGQLLPQSIDNILYLDCDTIIKGDISPLENQNLDQYVFNGVKDCIGKAYKNNIGIENDAPYINAGVMLMNLKLIRNIDIKNAIDQYMNSYEKFINYADQDILNGVFKGKIGIISPDYNVMTIDTIYSHKEICLLRKPTNFYIEQELVAAVNNPRIIHYTTNMEVIRPWFSNTNHPLANEFVRYMKISPWKDEKLEKKTYTSKEDRIIKVIQKLPRRLSLTLLGFIHSQARPLYIRHKAKK